MSNKLFSILFLLLLFHSGYSQSVYKTPSGKKYHLASCRMVNNVSQEITLTGAAEMGLEPCKICNPQPLSVAPPGNKAKGENQTVQCKGFTKNGTRCKHMTSIANGYCFQHNPDKE